jgi:hypothetical protein
MDDIQDREWSNIDLDHAYNLRICYAKGCTVPETSSRSRNPASLHTMPPLTLAEQDVLGLDVAVNDVARDGARLPTRSAHASSVSV